MSIKKMKCYGLQLVWLQCDHPAARGNILERLLQIANVSKLYFTRLTVKERTLDSKYIIYTRGRKSADRGIKSADRYRYRYRYKVQKFTYRNILSSKEKKTNTQNEIESVLLYANSSKKVTR